VGAALSGCGVQGGGGVSETAVLSIDGIAVDGAGEVLTSVTIVTAASVGKVLLGARVGHMLYRQPINSIITKVRNRKDMFFLCFGLLNRMISPGKE
jgi:hypothetical protein